MPIGVGDTYEEHSVMLNQGDRVYLYSDGVTETMNPDRELFGSKHLIETLLSARNMSLDESVVELLAELHRWSRDTVFRDDVTVLSVECVNDGLTRVLPAAPA